MQRAVITLNRLSNRTPRRDKAGATASRRGVVAALALIGILGAATAAWAANVDAGNNASGLPVPRFVSLKADHVNVRGGPTREHDVSWIFARSGLPVEIVAEYDNWRRIRDWEGSEGWVFHSLLSGKRAAVTTPNPRQKDALLLLRDKPESASAVVAKLQAGVFGTVKRCTGTWCRFMGSGFDGWIEQERLWGVYPSEKVD